VQLIKQIYEGGEKFESDAKIIKSLRDFKVPPENWPPILDAFTTESGEYHFGRVNINVAPAEVLRALPGVTPEQASQMVSIRDELSPQERATIAWPAMAQILTPESYDQLAGKITTRAFTFRIRFAAGEVEAADTAGTMVNRMVYEAVIDLSAPRPRIAYLRDVTQWQATIEIAMQQPSTFDVSDEEGLDETPSRTADHAASQPGAADTQPEGGSPNQTPVINSPKPPKPSATQDLNQQRRRIGRWTTGTMNGQ
jgi:hypothetical protein